MSHRSTHTFQILVAIAALAAAGYAVYYDAHQRALRASVPPEAPHVSLAPDSLSALSAIIYDPSTGQVLFEKNAEMQLPLASLTKLMTTDTALSTMSPTTTVRITKEALRADGSSGFKPGQTWPLGKLIKYGLLVSSNDAMAAVAESGGGQVFIDRMNAYAKEIGMTQSYFLNPSGLDLTSSTAGAYGSAHDMALLASAVYKQYPSFLENTLRSNTDSFGKVVGLPTAAPLFDVPGLIGAKTGYTDLAGGNLVAVFDGTLGHPLVAVVLHSTEKGRFDDMKTLIAAARSDQAPSGQLAENK
ncbi:MAG TPA: hypothetical protein VF803_03605 [Candidatus Paceibacterota bacterium]